MEKIICILCPKGCHLEVDPDNDYAVKGHSCPKGMVYGREELKNPVRVVTTTVTIKDSTLPRCPVKTNGMIPKKYVEQAVRLLDSVVVEAPVKLGDVIYKDICGTGVDFVASRSMAKKA